MRLLIGLLNGTLSSATPILLAALGGAFTYCAGTFNIAMEGMMLVAAFCAVLGSYFSGSWLVGVLCGVAGSTLLALIFILFAIGLQTDEFVTGIALNLFAVGATTYLLRQIFNVKGSLADARIQAIPAVDIPLLANLPLIGEVLSGQNLMVYVAALAVLLCGYLIFRTPFGLRLRAAGYNAPALDASGVPAWRVRVIALLLCGVLCGLAGAYLSLGYVRLFAENMSAGRGWISLAAIILVGGHPGSIALVSLLFGFSGGLDLFLQTYDIPAQFTGMAPYLATLLALYVYARRRRTRTLLSRS
ncbi:MAG: ABC transporter permease [Anaerolineales bacterium]|nr:ABC transporter permease [Anaerolineales bacterium]